MLYYGNLQMLRTSTHKQHKKKQDNYKFKNKTCIASQQLLKDIRLSHRKGELKLSTF